MQKYKFHLSNIGKAFDPYLETRKNAIEHLRQHPVVKEKAGAEFNVSDKHFCDLQECFKDYREAFVDFLSVADRSSSSTDEYKDAMDRALRRTIILTEAKSRFDRNVQRKIDDANSHLPDKDKVQMEDSQVRVIVKKGEVIDRDILNALMGSGIKEIKVRTQIVRNITIKKGKVIDRDILNALMSSGIKEIRIVTYSIKKEAIGKIVHSDITDENSNVIVKKGHPP